jgi:hypothetical protein
VCHPAKGSPFCRVCDLCQRTRGADEGIPARHWEGEVRLKSWVKDERTWRRFRIEEVGQAWDSRFSRWQCGRDRRRWTRGAGWCGARCRWRRSMRSRWSAAAPSSEARREGECVCQKFVSCMPAHALSASSGLSEREEVALLVLTLRRVNPRS